jgi:hypothetical protein
MSDNEQAAEHIAGCLYRVTVKVQKCSECGAHLATVDAAHQLRRLPWMNRGIVKQLELAGCKLVGRLGEFSSERSLCDDCLKTRAVFECDLCHQKRCGEDISESFGYPAEYLCRHCFETVSAKVWAEACGGLSESHRYDFE